MRQEDAERFMIRMAGEHRCPGCGLLFTLRGLPLEELPKQVSYRLEFNTFCSQCAQTAQEIVDAFYGLGRLVVVAKNPTQILVTRNVTVDGPPGGKA